jgi:hypothetical protein
MPAGTPKWRLSNREKRRAHRWRSTPAPRRHTRRKNDLRLNAQPPRRMRNPLAAPCFSSTRAPISLQDEGVSAVPRISSKSCSDKSSFWGAKSLFARKDRGSARVVIGCGLMGIVLSSSVCASSNLRAVARLWEGSTAVTHTVVWRHSVFWCTGGNAALWLA